MGSSSDMIYTRVDLESLCEVSKAKSKVVTPGLFLALSREWGSRTANESCRGDPEPLNQEHTFPPGLCRLSILLTSATNWIHPCVAWHVVSFWNFGKFSKRITFSSNKCPFINDAEYLRSICNSLCRAESAKERLRFSIETKLCKSSSLQWKVLTLLLTEVTYTVSTFRFPFFFPFPNYRYIFCNCEAFIAFLCISLCLLQFFYEQRLWDIKDCRLICEI